MLENLLSFTQTLFVSIGPLGVVALGFLQEITVTAEAGSYVVTESADLVIAKPGSHVEIEIE